MKDKVFPQSIKEGILIELKQGDDHDMVWQCNGGIYKAHKLILASSSEFLKVGNIYLYYIFINIYVYIYIYIGIYKYICISIL